MSAKNLHHFQKQLNNWLENTDITTAPLAFGGNVFGWTADEAMSFRLLDAFVDVGFNLIDTADIYSHGAPGNQGEVGNDRQVECGQRA